jgi:pyruvate/2-oxoglutarate dehydrogenase complex dihydrolipoamide acyltransferase (E2) component
MGRNAMATEVVMPQMGESITEGTLTKWLKKVGDTVQRDEPLFEISTDKVDAEIPSPAAGTLQEIKVAEGATVQINTVVAVIGDGGKGTETVPQGRPEAKASGYQPRWFCGGYGTGKPVPLTKNDSCRNPFSKTDGVELDGFAVEVGFLGVGEGVFGLDGGVGGFEGGLLAGLHLGGFVAHGLELLSFAAESTDFDGSGFGDECVAHRVIFSRSRGHG